MEEIGRITVNQKFTFKEKVLVGCRMFRLLAGDVLGLVGDAINQTGINGAVGSASPILLKEQS